MAAPVRLGDVADVQDSVSDVRNIGLANGKPSVLIIIFRQPGANIIETVDRVTRSDALFAVLDFSGDLADRGHGSHGHGARLGEGH